jgi:hypothetical protein
MRLASAVWNEGPSERRALVAQLPSDPGRVVDLNRLEHLRLAKLGEGEAEALALVLVPPGLGRLLEGGPRALQRARQVLAYAEKWQRRNRLPESLAPQASQVRFLPCLPRPSALRRWDGTHLDRLAVQGPGGTLAQLPRPTLALLGLHGGHPAGCCLAVEDTRGVVLGAWLELDMDWEGELELTVGGHRRRLPMDAWQGLELPALRPGEALLAPAPHFRLTAAQQPGVEIVLKCPFETLTLHLGETIHPTLQ